MFDCLNMTYEELRVTSSMFGIPMSTFVFYSLKGEYITTYLKEVCLDPQKKFELDLTIKRLVDFKNPAWIKAVAESGIPNINMNELFRGLLVCPDCQEKLFAMYIFVRESSAYIFKAKQEIDRLNKLDLATYENIEGTQYKYLKSTINRLNKNAK